MSFFSVTYRRINAPKVIAVEQSSVTLACEIYGYASYFGYPTYPTWIDSQNQDLRRLSHPRYSVTNSSSASQTLIHPNGETTSGIVLELTIRDVKVEDSGTFTCGDGFRGSGTTLTVVTSSGMPVLGLSCWVTNSTGSTSLA